MLGPPDHPQCEKSLKHTLSLYKELKFPISSEKTEGPTTTLPFLGIEIDSCIMQTRLPQEKPDSLQNTIAQWMKQTDHPSCRGSGKKRELLSLIGLLSHAASVVRPGRALLRSLIDVAASTQDLDHWVHLNSTARAYLAWWYIFLKFRNGTSIKPPMLPPLHMASEGHHTLGNICCCNILQ